MERQEIRWVQRLYSFQKALRQLEKAVQLVSTEIIAGDEHTLMQDGLIQRYEFSVELAWKLMKDYVQYDGITDRLGGPRETIRHALQLGLISDDNWMSMIEDRNLTSHTYDQEMAQHAVMKNINTYYPLLSQLEQTMSTKEAEL